MKEGHSLDTTSKYGCSKVAAEYLSRSFGTEFDVINIRPFSVYGEGEADHRFIPTVIKKILTQDTLMLDTEAVHDWVYVDDFVQAVLSLLDTKRLNTFNIGTGVETNNETVVKLIERTMQATAKIIEAPNMRKERPPSWRANTSKLKFKTKINLEEGLYETIPYYITKFVQDNAQK